LINQEDQKVALAIEKVLPQIAAAIDAAAERFKKGGRLIYCGAGTSGRLGGLDAIELTPTYSVSPERAFGILAGGEKAMY
ncbi:N-acetylmuramic acid 6-phosphate etherase, partial [Enterococcus faecalis]